MVRKMENKKSPEKLNDAELSEKLGYYQFIEALWSLFTILLVLAGIIVIFAVHNLAVGGILLFAGVAVGVFFAGGMQKKKKALMLQQMGDFFLSELEKAFGTEKDIPEMRIDKKFFKESHPVDECFEGCRTENYYCGEYGGICFSAANAVLEHTYEERAGQDGWMTHTDTVFEGVVLRCKTDAPKNVSLAVNRKEEKQPGPDIADPAAFSLRFDVRAENEYDIPAYVTQSFREMMKNIETATGGELYGVTLGCGILSLAIGTKYVFAGIPQNFDFSNIDGIRKYFVDSLRDMGRIIEIIEKNTALFGADK